MLSAPLPFNEQSRLRELAAYGILDTLPEKEFDDLAMLAAQLTGCPMAAINFIDMHRYWLKAKTGLEITEGKRAHALCTHTILQDDVLIINDPAEDERFCHNVALAGAGAVRFYAGAPIVSAEGHKLGAVCVLSLQQHQLTEQQKAGLQIIAAQVKKLLDLRSKNSLMLQMMEQQVIAEQRLMQRELQDREEERLKISTCLHEDLAQDLAAVKLYLNMAEHAPDLRLNLLKKAETLTGQLLDKTRALSQSLVPTTLRNDSIVEMMESLLPAYEGKLALEFSFSGSLQRIPLKLHLALFRIVQEQLKNILQHALARQVHVHLEVQDEVVLSIQNDGYGFSKMLFKGRSMNIIEKWPSFFGGRAFFENELRGGSRLTVYIPLPVE